MKNKFTKGLVKFLKNGCVTFTIVVFAFYILGDIMSSATKVLTLKNLILLYLFSVWFSASNIILRSKKMNLILRVVLHFVSTVLGFFVIFVYLPGNLENPSSASLLTIGFSALYIVIASLILGIKSAISKKKNEDAEDDEYDSIYDKNEDE